MVNTRLPVQCFIKSYEKVKEIIDAYNNGFEQLCFIGSSCMYPLSAPQPYKEESLGTGLVEETSAPYTYGKLSAWQLCKAISKSVSFHYFVVIPSDVYGDTRGTHFIPDLMRRFDQAKTNNEKAVHIWGTGSPIRQPLFDDDFVKALIFILNNYKESEVINVAPDESYSVGAVARILREIIGFKGDIIFDCDKPDGQMKKTLDNSKLKTLGFSHFTPLEEGLKKMYARFLDEK